MSIYTENVGGQKDLTNRTISSTPPKYQTKRTGCIITKQELCTHSNESGAFVASSTLPSNERDKNFTLKTNFQFESNSYERGCTVKTRNHSFFDMLQDYQPAVLGVIGTNQRSPGPAEFMQDKEIQNPVHPSYKDHHRNTNPQNDSIKTNRHLKVKNKIHRFLIHPKPKTDDSGILGLSVLTKNISINEDESKQSLFISSTKRTFLSTEEMQHQQRKLAFGHYDCQSLAAFINYIKPNRKLSISNISSSAVIAKPLQSILPELTKSPQDCERGNELLVSCPHFYNEIGGESNSRRFKASNNMDQNYVVSRSPRKQITPCNVSILESLSNETLWRAGVCQFQSDSCPIESVDHGAHYYKNYFYNQRHENWFGIDENVGPVAISIKKEKIHHTGKDQHHSHPRYQFRMIIRTSELLTLRGLIIEDCIINSRVSEKSVTSKELLEFIAPDIQLSCLRLGLSTLDSEQQLLKVDEQGLLSKYKVGILYCRSGQSSEEDMYNNEHAGPAFTEFLDIIGKRVRLKGFQLYKAGLDNKLDSTGTHSVYALYKNCEIMFHVCTMLPFTPNNRQQLLRKRHIGNDIVTIIFQEPGAVPFDPNKIRSQFQHVFLIVRVVNPCSRRTTYRVAVTRFKEVPEFGPALPASALFSKNKMFADFILAKTINAENAAHRSEKFSKLAIRTRREYLKDLCINYCTNTSLDAGNKFSIFANKKKEKMNIQFSGDLHQRGGICWRILLQDHGSHVVTECLVGISVETFVIMEESSKTIVFAIPTQSILGWSICDNFIRLFYHNGECITFHVAYLGATDEQIQIVERINAVTLGNGALELNMRRNMMGQLGFHVQPDGIVTQVDATGQAWCAGMRRGYRLVEVCTIIVATLSYAELIELLKTSVQISVIVIKTLSDGTPRQGCLNKTCKINLLNQNFVNSISNKYLLEKDDFRMKNFLRTDTDKHSVLNYKMDGLYEQRSLPHRSKNTSGSNTGINYFSSNSLGDGYKKTSGQTNLKSLHSLSNDKWNDSLEDPGQSKQNSHPFHNQYSFNHSFKFQESSVVKMNPNTFFLHSNGSKRKTWLQNDSLIFPQPDSQNFQHRNTQFKPTELKNTNLPPNDSYSFDNAFCTSPTQSSENIKIIKPKLTLKSKNVCNELTAKRSSPNVRTKKVDAGLIGLRMNRIQHSTSDYSRTNEFQTDILEIISSNCFSGNDSSQERDATLHLLNDNISSSIIFKNHEKHYGLHGSSDINVKSQESNTIASGSSIEQKKRSVQVHNSIPPTTPPLLPYSKDLDWTTLVDTATKAIILHHKDGKSSAEEPKSIYSYNYMQISRKYIGH